ncbi:MAG: ribosome recycling factor [Rickettsiales bacterium]
MDASIHSLKHSLNGLRTGRASVALLDPVRVEAYGSPTPISQVGTVSTPEAQMITVQVWDGGLVQSVIKAINEAGLGLNPMPDGQLIRIPIPQLSEERRKELSKKGHEYGENAKISIRNIRRDGMDAFKKLEKDKKISEDESRDHSEEVQKATDDFIKKVDQVVAEKQKEILAI